MEKQLAGPQINMLVGLLADSQLLEAALEVDPLTLNRHREDNR